MVFTLPVTSWVTAHLSFDARLAVELGVLYSFKYSAECILADSNGHFFFFPLNKQPVTFQT